MVDFLIDCDSVLNQINDELLKLVNAHLGTGYKTCDIHGVDVFAGLGVPEKEWLMELAVENGFCRQLEPAPWASKLIKNLQQLGEVYIVTAPYHMSPWMHDREAWLAEHFGIHRKKIMHVHAKHKIEGDFFLDDNPDNVHLWKCHHPNGVAVLFDSGVQYDCPISPDVEFAHDAEQAIDIAYKHFGKNA